MSLCICVFVAFFVICVSCRFLLFCFSRERVTGSPRFKARSAENMIKARVEGPCQTPQLMKAAPLEEEGATNPAVSCCFVSAACSPWRRPCRRSGTPGPAASGSGSALISLTCNGNNSNNGHNSNNMSTIHHSNTTTTHSNTIHVINKSNTSNSIHNIHNSNNSGNNSNSISTINDDTNTSKSACALPLRGLPSGK